jgi:hypothetical protein
MARSEENNGRKGKRKKKREARGDGPGREEDFKGPIAV